MTARLETLCREAERTLELSTGLVWAVRSCGDVRKRAAAVNLLEMTLEELGEKVSAIVACARGGEGVS